MINRKIVFVNRRRGLERREDADPCHNLPLDLYHRKRRKSAERRARARSLSDDYYAYVLTHERFGSSAKQ